MRPRGHQGLSPVTLAPRPCNLAHLAPDHRQHARLRPPPDRPPLRALALELLVSHMRTSPAEEALVDLVKCVPLSGQAALTGQSPSPILSLRALVMSDLVPPCVALA